LPWPLALAVAVATPASAWAATPIIDLPRGSVANAAFALGRQTGASISLQGEGTGERQVGALRGAIPVDRALQRLARAAGLTVRRVGPRAFILSPRPSLPVRVAQRPLARPAPRPVVVRAPAPEEPPQDIVVTASKRDTLSRRFAGQWSRIDGNDLALTGVRGTEAIETRSVGFSSTHLGAGRNKLFIRGIADSSFSGPTQSPVGQYLGDLRTGYAGPDPDLRLVDMEAVEILEGPQGTLYGAGALGGILLLRPNMPRAGKWSGEAGLGLSATEHGKPGGDLTATLNAPLGGSAALRLTGYRADEGGYIDNPVTGERDVNHVATSGGRLVATTELRPGWSADLLLAGQRIRGDDSQYSDRGGGDLDRSSPLALPFASDFGMASLVVRKDGGAVRFRSTTGLLRQSVDERFDLSDSATTRALDQRSRGRGVSSETRLWRPMRHGFSWLAGLSLLDYRYEVRRSRSERGSTTPLGGVTNRISEVTLYGELGAELLPWLDLTAGARWTRTDLTGEGQHLSLLAFDRLAASDPDRKERRLLPSASLLARPVAGLTLYARYQQGFRPGGLSIANDMVQLFRHDLLSTGEAGFRIGKPLIDRFDLAGSLSRSRWRHIQADYLDGLGLPVTANIGNGRIWSATLNGGMLVAPGLRLEGGLAWNDGRITQPSPEFERLFAATAALGTGSVMRIPNIARVAGRAALDWRHDLGGGRTLEASLYGRYVGHSRLGIGPRLGERQGDYVDSGFLARLTEGPRAWSLSLTNLSDEVGNRFAFGAPALTGDAQITPLRPRTLRIGLDWRF
jgi:outer membrane receptor protein involved in Fe transport